MRDEINWKKLAEQGRTHDRYHRAILLAMLRGLTEFLPISSSAHR